MASTWGAEVADLNRLARVLLPRIEARGGVPTYYEKWLLTLRERALLGEPRVDDGVLHAARALLEPGERFVRYSQRRPDSSTLPRTDIDPKAFLLSQGVKGTLAWRGGPVVKSVFDLGLYLVLLGDIQPRSILELGSGTGHSALLLRDIAAAAQPTGGARIPVVSIDVTPPALRAPDVTFLQGDLRHPADALAAVPFTELERPLLVIDDAHVSIACLLDTVAAVARPGDYFVIEDCVGKHDRVAEARSVRDGSWMLDTRFLDFFGHNATSAMDGIFTYQPMVARTKVSSKGGAR